MNFPALATYYALVADEFLRAYFVLGVGKVRHHARYFIMAHCLEVAFKASLANRSVAINDGTQSLKNLDEHIVREGDSCQEPLRRMRMHAKFLTKCANALLANFLCRTG